jgi:MFS transporter, DHA2 family, multidrug resistance protein
MGRNSDSRRWWALGALALSGQAIGLDATVLNVALPTMATSLHAATGQLQWFIAAYTLVLGALMIPAGALGDRFGRKKLLLAGLAIFGLASAACAFATSPGMLIAARAALGVGGALTLPLSLSMLPVLFADQAARSRATTIWVTASVVGLPLGPIIGGWLLDHFWWGSVFLINVPLIVVGALALALFLPESRSTRRRPADLPGIALSSAGLTGIIYGFIEAGQSSWGSPAAWVPMAAGAVLLGAFTAWERRSSHPLIDLALFTSRDFTIGTALATLANFALFGLLFVMPQYFQDIAGASPLGTGVRLLPMIAGMLAGTRLAPWIIKHTGTRPVIAAGFVLSAAALGLAATTHVHTGYGFAAVWITLLGAGLALALPAAMNAAIGALSAERSGSGSGLLQALRQVGGTIGVAILGTVLNTGYRGQLGTSRLPGSLSAAAHSSVTAGVAAGVQVARKLNDDTLVQAVRTAFVNGMDRTLIVCGILTVAGAVVALLFLPRRSPRLGPPVADREESVHEPVG